MGVPRDTGPEDPPHRDRVKVLMKTTENITENVENKLLAINPCLVKLVKHVRGDYQIYCVLLDCLLITPQPLKKVIIQ